MSTPAVYKAISNVMAAIGPIGISKDRRNQQQGYNFRGIDEVYNALNPIMSTAGLVVLPRVMTSEREERQTQKGGLLIYTRLKVEFDFIAVSDGSKHTIATVGEAMDSADKSSNKAMAAAYKYAAMMAFCIPTEGDNDADATTHDVMPRGTDKPQKAAPPPATPFDDAPAPSDIAREYIVALKGCTTMEALKDWFARSADEIDALSDADKHALRSEYADKMNVLKAFETRKAA
jgi:hypothetical protein